MRADPPRRFRLSDGLVLIAAAAVGMAGTRVFLPEVFSDASYAWARPHESSLERRVLGAFVCVLACLPVPAAMTVGWLIIVAVPPGQGLRRQVRRPGGAACLAVTFAVAVVAASMAAVRVVVLMSGPAISLRHYGSMIACLIFSFVIGPCVASSWVHLLVSGRWRPRASWTDRGGRVFGLFWILWTVPHAWILIMEL